MFVNGCEYVRGGSSCVAMTRLPIESSAVKIVIKSKKIKPNFTRTCGFYSQSSAVFPQPRAFNVKIKFPENLNRRRIDQTREWWKPRGHVVSAKPMWARRNSNPSAVYTTCVRKVNERLRVRRPAVIHNKRWRELTRSKTNFNVCSFVSRILQTTVRH